MKFAKEAADGGMAEVELGRLATTRASNDQVKQFGQRMVDDHGKANMQLMDLARRRNVTLPTTLTGKHKSEYDRLSKLSGEPFDREYVKLMVADHKKDVEDFRKQSSAAKDPELRMFAKETLPTLEEHLTMIQRLSREGVAATSGSSRDNGANRPRGTGGSSGR